MMRKATLLSSFLLTLFFFAQAQFKQIAEGPYFDMPNSGFAKILAMKDGSTMYFHVGFKNETIEVRCYDPVHRETAATSLKPEYGRLRAPQLEDLFEMNGDAVFLISEVQEKIPVLYRLIIDGKTGKLKKEEKLADLKKLTLGMGYAMGFGGVGAPGFYSSKDPDSDNYAVAIYNSFVSDRNKRLEIILYGKDHTEISRAYYVSEDEKYKYLDFVSMAVMGSEKVCLLVNGYNSGKENKDILIATLNKGASSVTFGELNFPKDSTMESGLVRYNPYSKKFVLALKMYAKKSKDAVMNIAVIDPFTLKMERRAMSSISEKLFEKSKDIYGKKYRYTGFPVSLETNADGSFSIIYEAYIGDHSTDIVVVNYTPNGEFINDYFIPKYFALDDPNAVANFVSFKNVYKQFAFINADGKKYLFINDTERNIERIEKNKEPIGIQGVDDMDAFYFQLTGNDAIPARKFLVSDPGNKKRSHPRALFRASGYDKKNNLFIAVFFEKDGKDNGFKLKWLQPQ